MGTEATGRVVLRRWPPTRVPGSTADRCAGPRDAPGVDDRVLHGRGRPDRARLPDPFRAQRVHRRRRLGVRALERRELGRARHQIGHQGRGDGVAGLIEQNLFEQGLGNPLREAAVLLASDQHRVEDAPAVVHRHQAGQADVPGLDIHVDDGDVGAERERGAGIGAHTLGGQGAVVGACTGGELAPADRPLRRAEHPEPTVDRALQIDGIHLEGSGRERAGSVHDLAGAREQDRPARLQRPRSPRPLPALHERRVGMDDTDVGVGDREHATDELRERGLVPLPERRGAHVGRRGAVGLDVDARELLRGEPGDLDVGGEPDAHRGPVAARAPFRLLGTERGIVGQLERAIEGHLVVPRVVFGPRRRPEREGVGRDQVPPPELRRVHPELDGQQIDGALDRRRRLGPARPSVRAERGHVRHHRPAAERDRVDRVDAGDHLGGGLAHERPELRVGADVRQDLEPQPRDAPVATCAELHPLHLRAPVGHADHRLAPGLRPAHRASELRAAFATTRYSGRSAPSRRTLHRRRGRSRGSSPAVDLEHVHAGRHARQTGTCDDTHTV